MVCCGWWVVSGEEPLSFPAAAARRPAGWVGNAAALLPSPALPLLTLPASRPTAEPGRAAPTSALAPTIPSADLPSTLLIFGVPAAVGLILVLAALWGFLACKVGKQRRKRKAADEDAEGRGPLALPVTAS